MHALFILGLACTFLHGMQSPYVQRIARRKPPPSITTTIDELHNLAGLIEDNKFEKFREKFKPKHIKTLIIHAALRSKNMHFIEHITETLASYEKSILTLHFLGKKPECHSIFKNFFTLQTKEITKQKSPNEIREMLLCGGSINVDGWIELLNFYQVENGSSLLHAATCLNNIPIIKKTLTDIRANSQNVVGETPLFCAKSKEAVELLCEYGALVNHTDHEGRTPLHVIAKGIGLEGVPIESNTISALVEKGANICALNKEEETPLACAQNVHNYYVNQYKKKLEQSRQVLDAYDHILSNSTIYQTIAQKLAIKIENQKREQAKSENKDDSKKLNLIEKRKRFIKEILLELQISGEKKQKWLEVLKTVHEEDQFKYSNAKQVTEFFEEKKRYHAEEISSILGTLNTILIQQTDFISLLEQAEKNALH